MRIIHTSDWHLGQYFYGKSRLAEHRGFLTWLIEQIKHHSVDAVIVTGDIFDTGSPPSYARTLYHQFIVSLQQTDCRLIFTAGNHDSPAMLNESQQLLACLNVTVVTTATPPNAQTVQLLYKAGRPAALICAIPYLRTRDLLISQPGQTLIEKQHALQAAISDYYQTYYQYARQQCQQLGVTVPIIMTGHLTTVGATPSDAERDIYIGTLRDIPTHAFPPAEYIALGHIHSAQRVGKSSAIYYSGSPIALSFDELHRPKTVNLLEFNGQTLSQITPLTIPTYQPMQQLKGDLTQIREHLQRLSATDSAQSTWLDIEIDDPEQRYNLVEHIETLTEKLPVEVLRLRRRKTARQAWLAKESEETLAALNVEEVFQRRLEQEEALTAHDKQQLTARFHEIIADLAQP